jgi:hypothetical protein
LYIADIIAKSSNIFLNKIFKGVFIIKHLLVILSLCSLASTAYGTKQQPEKILYKGQKYQLANVPLEKYFDANHPKPKELRQTSSSCRRGYVGAWEVKDKQLFLKSLGRFRGDKPMKEIPITLLFKDQKPPIKATWFTGALRIPHGQFLSCVRTRVYSTHENEYLHAGFQRASAFWVYEKDIYFRVEKGNIISEHHVDNKGKGATQSVRDWGWVLSTSIPIKEDFKWHDFSDVVTEDVSKFKKSGKSFKTRAILWTHEESKDVIFWIPATPATDFALIKCKSIPDNYNKKTGEHLEIKAHFEKETDGYSLHVDSVRPLKPGETMHHPGFKPPERPSEIR